MSLINPSRFATVKVGLGMRPSPFFSKPDASTGKEKYVLPSKIKLEVDMIPG